ncbi:hypothetical protein HYV82_04575 [Candidatus Woesearchaeota archaeon]|nr:hypothetical protein [Candidatus Woesearchaeota archaeon]
MAAWQLNAHNQNYDPSHLTLDTAVGISRDVEKGPEGSRSSYILNYAIMAFGAYQVARGVSRMKL